MRKTFLARRCMAVLLTLALVISLAPAVLAAGLVVTPGSVTLKIGETEQLTVTKAGGQPVQTPSWKSNDINVATVDTSGKVTAIAPGDAIITVSAGGGSLTGECRVTVTTPTVTITPNVSSIEIGNTVTLEAKLNGATANSWEWESDNTDAIDFDGSQNNAKAKVIAVGPGDATITVIAKDASGNELATSSRNITVDAPTITFEPTSLDLMVGGTGEVKAIISKKITGWGWSVEQVSSQYTTVEIEDERQNDTGERYTVTVSAPKEDKDENHLRFMYKPTSTSSTPNVKGVEALYTIRVGSPEIELNTKNLTLTVGEEKTLEASLTSPTAGSGKWKFTISAGSGIAEVVDNTNTPQTGITSIKGKNKGPATVLVEYIVGSGANEKTVASETCSVTVEEFKPPEIAEIANFDLKEGDTRELTAGLTPADMKGTWKWETVGTPPVDGAIRIADNTKQTCKIKADSLNNASATVPQQVKVTFTAEAEDPRNPDVVVEDSKTFFVTVKQADREIELDPSSLELDILKDATATVKVTVKKGGVPLSGSSDTITFEPELVDGDERVIATVTGIGTGTGTDNLNDGETTLTVKPIGTGTAKLRIVHKYGNASTGGGSIQAQATATCQITITGPSIKINPPTLEMNTYEKNMAELTAVLSGAGTVDTKNIKWDALKEVGTDPITGKPTYDKTDIIRITNDQGGLCRIEAVKDGTAYVRATYTLTGEVSGSISAMCKVTVGTYSMTINPEGEVRKEPGESTTISATVKKIGMGNVTVPNHEKNLSWQISDGTIARFDTANGPLQKSGTSKVKVVGIPGKTGTVQVTARWAYNGHSAEETLTIVFGAPEPESLNFTVSPSSLTLESGTEGRLTASGATIQWKDGKSRPAPSDFKASYTWKSSDPKVAAVDKDGKVTAVSAGEAEITATARATVNGVEITGERTVKVKVTVSTRVKSITITKPSNGSISMEAGTREAVTVVVDPEGTPYAWTSSDEAVARVEGGSIVAVKPGKATLTVTAGGLSATLEVTVNGLDQLQSEITVIEGKSVDVGELFKAYGAAEGKTPVYSPQDPNIASYNSGRIMGNSVGETTITASVGTYRISFKVTVVADATSTITLPTLYTQTQKTLPFRDFLDRFRQQGDGALDHIMGLSVDPAKGTLYYNYSANGESGSGVGAGNYYLSPGVGQRGISEITFVPRTNYSGQVVINYTVVTKDNKNLACRIIFDVDPGDGSSAGLFLKTDYNTPLRFNGDGFNRVCRERLGAQLDYVTFSQPSERVGALYTDYVSSGNYGSVVDPRTHYSRSALNNVWFVPAPGFSGSATVYYTAYAVGGGSFAGQMDITVGVEDGVTISGLTYDISRGGVARFDDADFNRYCRQVLDFGQTVSYVRFDRLPAESEGILWYDYTSSSNTGERASTGTSYYYGTRSPRIDWLTFVPASGFTGTVKIPFTGWTTDGGRFTGTVEVNVRGGSTAGDILYICRAGETVRFDDTDFNGLCRDVTGSSLNYIQFTNLPGGSSGAVYYNNSRASTSTRYRNGSSTPRIDNLSFRASSSFAGAVDIPFEGRSTNGETFYGVVTVATSADAVGGGGSTGASQSVFTDMAGYSDAQKAAVNYLYDHNITRGMTTTQFGPQNSIRRGDFARMLYQAFDLAPTASTKVFTDVPANAYYAQAVNALHSRGIVSGIGGGLFAPNDTLTRQDAICMVQRAMRSVGWSADDGPASALYRYSDGGSVAGYAQGAMSFAVQRGILPTGGSWLNPTQPLTRVDMAEIIYRVLAG